MEFTESLLDEVPTFESAAMVVSASEQASGYQNWRRVGKLALAGSALVVAAGIPVAANIMEGISHLGPTHVPVTIAGTTVTAQIMPGRDLIKVEAFGGAGRYHSSYKLGRKNFGLDVQFNTENLSLATASGSPDMNKLNAIARRFSDPSPQRNEIVSALKHDIEQKSLHTGLATLGWEVGLASAYVFGRRKLNSYSQAEQRLKLRDSRLLNTLGAAGIIMVAGLPLAHDTAFYLSDNHHELIKPDLAFDGTAAEGWQVTGPFASFIDVSWHSLNKISSDKNKYYGEMLTNFDTSFHKKYAVDQLPKPAHAKRILFLDDLQGMDGPTLVIGAAAKAFNVDVIAIGGDTEDSDTPFISVLDGLHEHAKGVPVIMGTGIHDPANIAKMAKERGFTIANNDVQTVAGIPFLAVADASAFPAFAADKNLIKPGFTDEDVTNLISKTACNNAQPLIALMHDHKIGMPLATTNCAATVLMGRSYVPAAPEDFGNSVAVTSGSSGGHTFGEGINLTGIIAGPAEFQIIDVNDNTLQFESSTHVFMDPVPKLGGDTSTPSRTVTISDPLYRAQISHSPTDITLPRRTISAAKPKF